MNKQIQEYIKSCKFNKKIFLDYYGESNRSGFMHDKRTHDYARSRCKNILERLGEVRESEIIEACKHAFSGRLTWNGAKFEYTAGQFGNLEMPQAMEAVLELIENNRTLS